jgi:hypothetical protein
VKLAEMAQHGLGAELDDAGAAGMIPAGAPDASICSRSTGAPQASSTAIASALASNTPTGLGGAISDGRRTGHPAVPRRMPPATRRWPSGVSFLIGARDLEQRDIAEAAVGIALRGEPAGPAAARDACRTCRRRSG